MIIRPAITELGRQVLNQYDGDVAAWRQRSQNATSSITNLIDSPGAIANINSPAAVQSTHVQIAEQAANDLHLLARALEQAIPVLNGANNDQLVAAVEDLRSAAQVVSHEPGLGRRALSRLRDVLLGASTGALGSEVFAPICDQLIHLLEQAT